MDDVGCAPPEGCITLGAGYVTFDIDVVLRESEGEDLTLQKDWGSLRDKSINVQNRTASTTIDRSSHTMQGASPLQDARPRGWRDRVSARRHCFRSSARTPSL